MQSKPQLTPEEKDLIIDTTIHAPPRSQNTLNLPVYDSIDRVYSAYTEESIPISPALSDLALNKDEATLHNKLYQVGFDEDFVDGAYGTYQPSVLTKEVESNVMSVEDVAYNVSLISPFIAALIQQMSSKPDWSPYVVSKLLQLGFSNTFIDTFVVFPSGRPRSSIFTGEDLKTLSLRDTGSYWTMGSTDTVLMTESWLGKTVVQEQDTIIPVVRYGGGMKRQESRISGIYHARVEGQYCGFFYYYEPASEVVLMAHNILITPNKITACIHVLGKDETYKLLVNNLDPQGNYIATGGYEPASPSSYAAIALNNEHLKEFEKLDQRLQWEIIFNTMTTGRYPFLIFNEYAYAAEDKLDQPICHAATEQGFDVVIFTTMTGGSRVVSEVYDVRADSYDHLALLVQ